MKILLIQPPWFGFQNIISPRPYLGLAYIAAILEKDEHQVCVFNGETFFKDIKNEGEHFAINETAYLKNFTHEHQVYKDIMTAAKEFSPELVGISFMTANSSSAYILAKLFKTYNPSLPLIAGGVHPTLLPEEPLKKGFDFVVKGEGEKTIAALVKVLGGNRNFGSILSLSYIKNGEIRHNDTRPFIKNLDEVPFPAFHLLQNLEAQQIYCKGIITSRGCPFECNYCASGLLWTRQSRFRSPENVAAEIKDRYRKLGIRSFSFQDDTMTLNHQFVEKLCRLIIDFDFRIIWQCDTRGDTLDFDLLKSMKKAGCIHIRIGLESGSPKIQEMIKKRIKTEKIKIALQMARTLGIETTVYFMVGFPDETEEDIKLSIEVMKKLNPNHAIWSILTPFPGTETWEIAKKRGLVNSNSNWDTFFHHFNQGNIFKTLSDEKWSEMLSLIDQVQKTQEKKYSFIKFKNKIKNYRILLKLGLNDPGRLLKFIKNRM